MIPHLRNQYSSCCVVTIEQFPIRQSDIYPQVLPWLKLLLHVNTGEDAFVQKKYATDSLHSITNGHSSIEGLMKINIYTTEGNKGFLERLF